MLLNLAKNRSRSKYDARNTNRKCQYVNSIAYFWNTTYFHKQREEIQQLHKKRKELEEEIQSLNKQKLAIEEKLNNSYKISNVTEENLQDFILVKKELEFHGISMWDQAKFVKCVVGIKNLCDYNPFEAVEKNLLI